MKSVLVIDDEVQICDSIQLILEYENYLVDSANDGEQGLQKVKNGQYDVILLDIQLPGLNGFEVLSEIKKLPGNVHVIMISAFGNIENAVKATKLGAFDFIEKPIDRDKLLITVRNASEAVKLLRENTEFKKVYSDETLIIGRSKPTLAILDIIDKVAPTDARVLITGDNGTGKELVARSIHMGSNRKSLPFIDVNCAAIPNDLIESELFGHEKGAFTGANQQRIGKFELADKGTLFLDEIGDMSLAAQAKVLRAIEEGKIERVGGSKKIAVDVRILAATNKNLPDEIANGNFREDLYHRLNVIPIRVPSLRERIDDIPVLIEHFTHQLCKKYNKPLMIFSSAVLQSMQRLPWQGNIRELRNIVERIIIMVSKPVIEVNDVEFLLPAGKRDVEELILTSNSFQDFKEKAERAFILKQLELNGWNISKTAELMDIQRSHLYNKMKKYGLAKETDNG
ncbi:MAG: sigma-54 dependent transcriptional regulator [Ignavibacteria bacterium]|nr:sigma-54 dependent transcriptional regulator [Ignavibacteria bacterium]